MPIRSFIAVPVPKQMANQLGDLAAQMAYQDKSNAVRWVDQENYHITLAFLGDQEEQDLEQLAEVLDENLQQNSLSVTVSHLSPFPEGRPKLIAAMINRNDELRELHRQVVSSLYASPVSVDKRRFTPHITLGRYRHSKNQFAGTIPTSMDLTAELAEVTLFESTLTEAGAVYQAIFRFPLDEFEFDSDQTSR